jgi:hypothetical protein
MKSIFWVALGLCLASAALDAAPAVYQVFEAEFQASKPPESPLLLRPRVTFTGPAGAETAVEAFWDGGATFKVRFQPLRAGQYSYRVSSSDPASTEKPASSPPPSPRAPLPSTSTAPPSSRQIAASSPTPTAPPGSGSPTPPGTAPCSRPATSGPTISKPAPPSASPPSSSS